MRLRAQSDWDIVKRGWCAHVLGEAEHTFKDPVEAVTTLRVRNCTRSTKIVNMITFAMLFPSKRSQYKPRSWSVSTKQWIKSSQYVFMKSVVQCQAVDQEYYPTQQYGTESGP